MLATLSASEMQCSLYCLHRLTAACPPATPGTLQEFQEAARCLEFPPVQRDRVANLLLAYKSRWAAGCVGGPSSGWIGRLLGCRTRCALQSSLSNLRTRLTCCLLPGTNHRRNGGGVGRAAEELARGAAREALGPLLDAACARLGAVVKRAYDIAADQAQHQRGAGAAWGERLQTVASLGWDGRLQPAHLVVLPACLPSPQSTSGCGRTWRFMLRCAPPSRPLWRGWRSGARALCGTTWRPPPASTPSACWRVSQAVVGDVECVHFGCSIPGAMRCAVGAVALAIHGMQLFPPKLRCCSSDLISCPRAESATPEDLPSVYDASQGGAPLETDENEAAPLGRAPFAETQQVRCTDMG